MFLIKSREYRRAKKELLIINSFKDEFRKLSDEQLQNKTIEFKERIKNGTSLKDLRCEAFGVAREATYRITKKWMFDVQILGSLILDYGSVAEMKTGEGKTIASIPPIYLNALEEKGVIVSTVNEYLCQRDAEENGEVFSFLGLTYGVNLKKLDSEEKKEAYAKDVTYSIHSEIGFDYLRDNMVQRFEDKVQRGMNYCLVDEIDSILIDEAKTPLIITGGDENLSQIYVATDIFTKTLTTKDYKVDWETKTIQLTDFGYLKANKFFKTSSIYNIENSEVVHRIQNSLRANYLMKKDHDYIVREDTILLIDTFTGRIMDGRSYSDGLQQAIQAKEKVTVESETKTLATITYQNLFRMFKKLAGMTGTGKTEEEEFIEIYNMRVNVIPTNKPIVRIDHTDIVYNNLKNKFNAIVEKIKEIHATGQPILVGTESVHDSEILASKLDIANIRHTILNAKQDQNEAEIIAKAGEVNAVTLATNMAGRGTDIKLTDQTRSLGGLYVIGTSKAESRRIDNQLKGRSGRQGDPGSSVFIISVQDSLLKRFSKHERISSQFKDHGPYPIKHKIIKKSLNKAQKIIEGSNFDARKNVLQFDDIIRQQRNLIYAQRDIIISQNNLYDVVKRMLYSVIDDFVVFPSFLNNQKLIIIDKICETLNAVWLKNVEYKLKHETFFSKTNEEIIRILKTEIKNCYDIIRERVIQNIGEDGNVEIERQIILKTFDDNWKMHLDQMTKLRSSSSLASYAQKNPFQVYIEKGNELFKELLERISHNTIKIIMNNEYANVVEEENID